jgi:hypothetical protein
MTPHARIACWLLLHLPICSGLPRLHALGAMAAIAHARFHIMTTASKSWFPSDRYQTG